MVFLDEQIPLYATAVANGTIKEFIDTVYARYARRFPIEMPLEVDPSPEALAAVDDDSPESEAEDFHDDLSPEEQEAEEKRITDRRALIRKRKSVCVHCLHLKARSSCLNETHH